MNINTNMTIFDPFNPHDHWSWQHLTNKPSLQSSMFNIKVTASVLSCIISSPNSPYLPSITWSLMSFDPAAPHQQVHSPISYIKNTITFQPSYLSYPQLILCSFPVSPNTSCPLILAVPQQSPCSPISWVYIDSIKNSTFRSCLSLPESPQLLSIT